VVARFYWISITQTLSLEWRGKRLLLVHQVRDWYSGVAIKAGRRQGATKEHI